MVVIAADKAVVNVAVLVDLRLNKFDKQTDKFESQTAPLSLSPPLPPSPTQLLWWHQRQTDRLTDRQTEREHLAQLCKQPTDGASSPVSHQPHHTHRDTLPSLCCWRP